MCSTVISSVEQIFCLITVYAAEGGSLSRHAGIWPLGQNSLRTKTSKQHDRTMAILKMKKKRAVKRD